MRPKKKILLFSKSETHSSILQMLLEVRGGYKVLVVADAENALAIISDGEHDVLLAECLAHNEEANELARRAKVVKRDLPSVIFSRSVSSYERGCHADAFIPELHCNSEEILLRVGILARRKRGPKPSIVPREAAAVPA